MLAKTCVRIYCHRMRSIVQNTNPHNRNGPKARCSIRNGRLTDTRRVSTHLKQPQWQTLSKKTKKNKMTKATTIHKVVSNLPDINDGILSSSTISKTRDYKKIDYKCHTNRHLSSFAPRYSVFGKVCQHSNIKNLRIGAKKILKTYTGGVSNTQLLHSYASIVTTELSALPFHPQSQGIII